MPAPGPAGSPPSGAVAWPQKAAGAAAEAEAEDGAAGAGTAGAEQAVNGAPEQKEGRVEAEQPPAGPKEEKESDEVPTKDAGEESKREAPA